ncbi:MAG: PEP-CTERM sorting domain-containing protein [Thiobacillus sp.]
MNTQKMRLAALVLAMGVSGAVQAALHDRGGGLIYDDVLDITWLADANYAQTSGYDADGLTNGGWAMNLVYHDVIRNVDYADWRLPETAYIEGAPWEPDPTCNGLYSDFNCTGSEMGHLFYVDLGGVAGTSIATTHNAATYSLFSNIQPGTYWSGTSVPSASLLWAFDMDTGRQHTADAVGDYITYPTHYAWAVRNGDVAAVPEADTWAMLLAGLGLVSLAARRRATVK